MVKLVREPNNPYDKWAVRVDNVIGEKVGHLSRQVAFAVRSLTLHGISSPKRTCILREPPRLDIFHTAC